MVLQEFTQFKRIIIEGGAKLLSLTERLGAIGVALMSNWKVMQILFLILFMFSFGIAFSILLKIAIRGIVRALLV